MEEHPEKRIMTKHPEYHRGDTRRVGIVLVLGGLNWYLEYCWHLVCWDGGHPKKETMREKVCALQVNLYR